MNGKKLSLLEKYAFKLGFIRIDRHTIRRGQIAYSCPEKRGGHQCPNFIDFEFWDGKKLNGWLVPDKPCEGQH